MTVTQLTISIPNEPGDLEKISELLGDAGVNMLAILVSTTTPDGDGLVRFISDNPERAVNVLDTRGIAVSTSEVIAADTPHHAGGLLAVLKPLTTVGANIDYLYPCSSEGKNTIMIIGVAKEKIDLAVDALKKSWIALFGDELYHM